MNYWLMKSEPDVFSIQDLNRVKVEPWDGIRNYQARNFIRDEMRKGDEAFFYHSNCDEPGIVGIMRIHKEAYPDHTAFDPKQKYYDPRSNKDEPRWFTVDVEYIRTLQRVISLKELREHKILSDMLLLRRGNRLSIMPISKKHWEFILKLE